jgi:hypothetical protein
MYSPIEGKTMWGENEPPREMSQLTPRLAQGGNQPSPRWNQYPPGTAIGGDGTPLRSSFQRDDVGPGAGQVQDPNLHEQYFGIADGGEDEAVGTGGGPSQGLGLYENQHPLQQHHTPTLNYPHPQASGGEREEERGHWVQ